MPPGPVGRPQIFVPVFVFGCGDGDGPGEDEWASCERYLEIVGELVLWWCWGHGGWLCCGSCAGVNVERAAICS